MARVMWTRGVDIEIVLSNPGSIPGGLKGTEANYGNGWSCVDVAAAKNNRFGPAADLFENGDLKVGETLRGLVDLRALRCARRPVDCFAHFSFPIAREYPVSYPYMGPRCPVCQV